MAQVIIPNANRPPLMSVPGKFGSRSTDGCVSVPDARESCLRLLRFLRHVTLMTFCRLRRAGVDAVARTGIHPSTAGDRANREDTD
jgi:hypothetical protein